MNMTFSTLFYATVFIIAVLGFLSYRNMTPPPAEKSPAPNFSLPDAAGKTHKIADYNGKWLVLYFYPKDDTPGCTAEACHFRDDMAQLTQLGASVVGISVDDGQSHAEFSKKYNLPFPLLSDKDGLVASSYGALTNLYLAKFAKRYTFLIDPQGLVAKAYLNVNTSKHSQQIVDDLSKIIR